MDAGDAWLLGLVTGRIIGCASRCANAPGHGFVEKLSENALAHEVRKCAPGAVQQPGIAVFCDNVSVGEFTGGRLVEDQVIVERKAVTALSDVHLPQCRNDGQAPVPASQLRPLQSRKPPSYPLLRVHSPLTRVFARPPTRRAVYPESSRFRVYLNVNGWPILTPAFVIFAVRDLRHPPERKYF
jgi:GxxExxY protein